MNVIWGGMDVIIAPSNWSWAWEASASEFAEWLRVEAGKVDVSRYRKTTRGPKKVAKTGGRQNPHCSTQRLLNARKILPKILDATLKGMV